MQRRARGLARGSPALRVRDVERVGSDGRRVRKRDHVEPFRPARRNAHELRKRARDQRRRRIARRSAIKRLRSAREERSRERRVGELRLERIEVDAAATAARRTDAPAVGPGVDRHRRRDARADHELVRSAPDRNRAGRPTAGIFRSLRAAKAFGPVQHRLRNRNRRIAVRTAKRLQDVDARREVAVIDRADGQLQRDVGRPGIALRDRRRRVCLTGRAAGRERERECGVPA